jgi:hypothetical protein
VRDPNQPGELPLRPLTTGELLDAATVLLRLRGRTVVALAAVLAVTEQLVLLLVRRGAPTHSVVLVSVPGFPALHFPPFYGGMPAIFGLFTEVLCIGLLAAVAARAAPLALLGPNNGGQARFTAATAPMAVLPALTAAAAGWTFLVTTSWFVPYVLTALLWPLGYGLFGLVVPAIVVDQVSPSRAIDRSLVLSASNAMRAAMIRVLGYGAWLTVRLAVVVAVLGLLDAFSLEANNLVVAGAFAVVNTLAYATLGCLDVALHLDTRMRVEGLDLALRRDLRVRATLAVRR